MISKYLSINRVHITTYYKLYVQEIIETNRLSITETEIAVGVTDVCKGEFTRNIAFIISV
jgi:hypothetical protein